MDQIAELLARLQELSAEELTELEGLIDAEWAKLAAPDAVANAESVDAMNQLMAGKTEVRTETTRRETEAAESAAARDDLLAKMEAINKGEDPDAKTEPEAEKPVEGAEEVTAEGKDGEAGGDEDKSKGPIGEKVPVGAGAEAAAAGDEAALVAAGWTPPRGSAGHIEKMAAGNHAGGSPELEGAGKTPYTVTIVAAAGLPSVGAGDVFGDSMALAEAMSEKLMRLQTSQDHTAALVASARWSYPEERTLTRDMDENTRKLNAVCGIGAPRVNRRTGAIVASGGICLPTNVDYSVPTWSSADRPLRDGLPAFQATRGGLQFVTPPDIGVPTLQGGTASGAGLATGIWTEATDANPAGATKPVWQVACGTPQEIYVDAIPTRVEFGNMISRFAPEQVAANTEQAVATAAREAELNLLAKMYTNSNQVLAHQYLGATRDLLTTVDLIGPQYRYSHRYPKNISLTAVFPEWAADVIRSDMARELAHDNTNGRDVMAITDQQIEDWFSARNIEVIWTMDALQGGTYGSGGSALPNQYFAKITPGAQPQWPGQTSDGAFVLGWLLFVTGTFQFLDGGRMDLGVVRDTLLDATNDYETFVETFEGIAFRGNECYQVQSTILPTGGSAGTVASSGYHE